MTLGIFVDRICEAVGDAAKARYSEAVIAEGLRLALEEYSRAAPQIGEITITVENPGRDQAVVGVDRLLYILSVQFPVSAGSAPEVSRFTARLCAGLQMISIAPPAPVPQAGEQIRVVYAAQHTVAGLDAAEATTVPVVDFGLLVQGAAGHAMSIRADSIVESYGKRTPQEDVFAAAKRRLDDFRRRLRTRKAPEMPAPPWEQSPQALPAGRWRLDRLDGSEDA